MMARRRKLAIVIGCGGLLYHAMQGLKILLRGYDVMFYDPDTVEIGNGDRQWGHVGVNKAVVARDAMELGTSQIGWARPVAFTLDDAYAEMVAGTGLPQPYAETVVIALPDNANARVLGWEAASTLWDDGQDVVFVTAGNALDGGQAYAVRMKAASAKMFRERRLKSLTTEAMSEAAGMARSGADVHQCGRTVMQSLHGNMLTATRLIRVMEQVLIGWGGQTAGYAEAWWDESPHTIDEASGVMTKSVKMWGEAHPDKTTGDEVLAGPCAFGDTMLQPISTNDLLARVSKMADGAEEEAARDFGADAD